MTIYGTININGTVYKFETDEPDKAIKAIVLLSGKADGENNNAIGVLSSIADNLNTTESKLDEDEDDEEACDLAYDEGYDDGYDRNDYDNPYPVGSSRWEAFSDGYRNGTVDKNFDDDEADKADYEEAYEEGYSAGNKNGRNASNPYVEDTPSWEGFEDGVIKAIQNSH